MSTSSLQTTHTNVVFWVRGYKGAHTVSRTEDTRLEGAQELIRVSFLLGVSDNQVVVFISVEDLSRSCPLQTPPSAALS